MELTRIRDIRSFYHFRYSDAIQDLLKIFSLIRMWNLGRCISAGKVSWKAGNPISWAREVGKPGSIFAHPRALIRMWSSSRRIDTQWRKYDVSRFFLFSLENLSRLKHATTNVDAWKIIRSIKPYIHRSIGTSLKLGKCKNVKFTQNSTVKSSQLFSN